MMGRQRQQASLFYTVDLEEFVPQTHILRKIDKVLDLSFVREHLQPFYSTIGRPSIDPELMIRMLLVGYLMGIRSERRLIQEISLNLAYRWFCRLDLDAKVPHHSSFSKNRYERFRESGVYRELFEQVVLQCLEYGLVSGESCSVDGCVVTADASPNRREKGKLSEGQLSEKERNTRPVQEYLEALEAENLAQETKPEKKKPGPQAEKPKPGPARQNKKEFTPKYSSKTDPQAAWASKHQFEFAYASNYLIDHAYGIILDVEAEPARPSLEIPAAQIMIERTHACLNISPDWMAADKAYGTGVFLHWLFEKDITPYISVLDHKHKAGDYFTQDRFTFVEDENHYLCPADKKLTFRGKNYTDGIDIYSSNTETCRGCALKDQCTAAKYRRLSRNWYEPARQKACDLTRTEEFIRASQDRKMIEQRFARLKHHMGIRRLKLRGLSGASEEFLLAALSENLKILAGKLCSKVFSVLWHLKQHKTPEFRPIITFQTVI